jgi:hypothetical protein
MVKRHTLLLAVLTLLCASVANAASEHDNLERGEDSQDSYYKAIRRILWQGWRRDVVLRMIVRPPFDKEHILGVRRVGRQYRCFVVNPSSHIWSEEVKRHTAGAGKPDPSHIRGEFDETPVREDFVLRLAQIWRKGINDPKSYLSAAEKQRSIYLDSTEFYFLVALFPHEHLTAHTVESAGRNAEAMIRVGFDLPRYVWHDITGAAYGESLARAEKTLGIKTDAANTP